jgi:TonB-dependent SusC/RagA subfamily outer membrane receptor
MKRLASFLVLLVFACMQLLQAQGVQITGSVTNSEDGSALPGVSIVIQGTTMGTVTDYNGEYSLTVPDATTRLILSFVGMKTQEVAIAGKTVVDVVMEPDILGLDEVVVTALGISREKKSLGYATQEVSGDEVNKVKSDNFVNSISGKVSGVRVKSNGNMGGSTDVVIRGAKSFIGSNQALFVVDGVPVSNANTNNQGQLDGRSGYDYGNFAADINPADIESISVLKGAAASALYGSRAANGVIMITTKKGSRERPWALSLTPVSPSVPMIRVPFQNTRRNTGVATDPITVKETIPASRNMTLTGTERTTWLSPSTKMPRWEKNLIPT